MLDQDLPDAVSAAESNCCALWRDMVIDETVKTRSGGHVFRVLALEPWQHDAPVPLFDAHFEPRFGALKFHERPLPWRSRLA